MSDVIARLNAALEGRYEIDREIGEGGMATVYLARDVKHNRNVAVKVLKPELAAVVGADRFLAEIETTANLQHPHILPLFDSGEADSFLFYVMPYIDGETLADRLEREKQLPVEEAIGIASAVANALHTAHEAGVVHRDIKPGNILMSQGEPLVSDFGIALAVGAAGGNRLTETGLSVGTPYYMSPEQATGDQQIGPASDTYALACVLYEMLVGEPPYTGNTAQAVLGKILMGELVSATAVRASIPANVDGAIRKALEKLPADRFTGAQAFAKALGDTGFRHGVAASVEDGAADSADATKWRRIAIAAGIVAVAGLAAAAREWTRPAPPAQPVVRASVDLGDLSLLPFGHGVTISPDGSMLAVVVREDGTNALYIRGTNEAEFRRVPGTEDAITPAFSTDGEWLVFASDGDGTLSRVSISGGAPRLIVNDDVEAFEPDWSEDGTVFFAGTVDGVDGIYSVPDTGGDPALVLETSEHGTPRAIPGGRFLLLFSGQDRSADLLDTETDSVRTLIPDAIAASWIETGHVVYADASGGLWAVAFDRDRGETTGTPTPVLDGVSVPFGFYARYAVSTNGTFVYGSGAPTGGRGGGDQQLVIVDLEGNAEVQPLEPRLFGGLRWAPDGSTVAYASAESFEDDLHIFTYNVDLGTTPRQLTFTGTNRNQVWSPDGSRVAFTSNREGTDGFDLFVKTVNDDSPPELVATLPERERPSDWVPDSVLVFEVGGGGTVDLWMMEIGDSASARPYYEAEWYVGRGMASPDGTLLAYESQETDVYEIYVRSFPEPRQPIIVSNGGGQTPRWAPDGNTLYYWKTGSVDTLYAARLQREPTFAVTSLEPLFAGDYSTASADLSPDGTRWAIPKAVGAADATTGVEPEKFFIVTNWFTELRAALGEDDR
jgi:serine/threonine-protein kinase